MSTNTAILIALLVIVVFCVLYYFWSKYRSTKSGCDNAEHGSKHHHHAECGAEVACPGEATDVSAMASEESAVEPEQGAESVKAESVKAESVKVASAKVGSVKVASVKATSIKAAGKEHYGELAAPVY
jgi:predicted cobalt transporter CbtA